MKTIFITVYDGLISKNILKTNVFKILKKQDNLRIVLFVSSIKLNYYRECFKSDRVFIESIPRATSPKIEKILFMIASNSLTNTNALFRQKAAYLKWNRFHYFIIARILRIFGNFKLWNSLITFLYYHTVDSSFDKFILEYKPDLFFVSNLVASEDIRLMKLAKKENIYCIAMTKSWDNVGAKPFIFLYFDKLIVQNEIIKKEANSILGIDYSKINVSGFPQYDIYIDKKLIIKKDDFYKEVSANIKKKLILYSATGFTWTPHEYEVLEMLNDAIEQGKIIEPVQVLVRFHPKYPNPEESLKRLPHLICERPGTYTSDRLAQWEYEKKDVVHLMNSIYHSDICINTGSTMAIEGMIFDKPSIGIAFDGYQNLPLYKSVRRFYKFPHNKKLVELGGEDVVYSIDKLVGSINDYLKNPNKRAKGRELTRMKECYRIDGLAGKRIADIILNSLN